MKTLHLLRHGKSSWEYDSINDIDRTLLERGMSNTYKIARRFLLNFKIPDLIISSHANRAIHTAHIFARSVGYDVNNILITDKIYDASNNAIMDVIVNTSDTIEHLLLVGHNPNFTEIANYYLDPTIENLSTSAMASIVFDTDEWKKIQNCEFKSQHDRPM